MIEGSMLMRLGTVFNAVGAISILLSLHIEKKCGPIRTSGFLGSFGLVIFILGNALLTSAITVSLVQP